jgi:glycyl-tRNA synthetase beta subunit
MTTASLLVELLTEELPPKALKRLGEAFAESILKGLRQDGLTESTTQVQGFASPRRLAVRLTAIRPQAPDRPKKEKLLPTAIALDASGKPTAPLIKKLAALGVTLGKDCELIFSASTMASRNSCFMNSPPRAHRWPSHFSLPSRRPSKACQSQKS